MGARNLPGEAGAGRSLDRHSLVGRGLHRFPSSCMPMAVSRLGCGVYLLDPLHIGFRRDLHGFRLDRRGEAIGLPLGRG